MIARKRRAADGPSPIAGRFPRRVSCLVYTDSDISTRREANLTHPIPDLVIEESSFSFLSPIIVTQIFHPRSLESGACEVVFSVTAPWRLPHHQELPQFSRT